MTARDRQFMSQTLFKTAAVENFCQRVGSSRGFQGRQCAGSVL
jgi:hypothetical protein